MTFAKPDGEQGFALIAALFGVMMFAFFAYAVLAADRGATTGLDAQIRRAQLEAAADAGLAMAVEGLGAGPNDRWISDGRSHSLAFEDMDVDALVEDERGKVPLNGLSGDQMRRLLASTGVSGAALDQLVDNLLNWEDGGERANGAKRLDYAAEGVRQRAGPVKTFGELTAIHAMTPRVLEQIAPVTTLFLAPGASFDAQSASPLALKVMSNTSADSPDAIIRARELAGERAKLDAGPDVQYVGRPFTVRVTVHDGHDGVFERSTVVVLTGLPHQPFWVRAID